ncbi:MAG: putative drug exporter of the superfamily [Actinomycetota bacterium]|nr:putative drug exporter of the superfamily [Actinomycetota bacterium]
MAADKGAIVSGLLERLGRRAVRHRWWFIGTWFVLAILVGALAIGLQAKLSDNLRIPDAQSQQALDLLQQDFPTAAGDNALIAIQATAGIKSPAVQSAIERSVTALQKIPRVTTVTDPFGPLGGAAISKNGQIAVLTVQFDTKAQNLEQRVFDEIEAAMAPTVKAGAKVAYGGAVIDYLHQPPSGNADLIGLLAAVVILLFAFGSVVAMGLPILTALLGLGVGMALIQIIASVTEIGTVAPVLATMIGLGVGIDYSLFIVTRYRENRAAGLELEAAVGRSVATAGSAVLFAGSTVVIAICGLAISGIPYVAKLGYMAGVVVLVMMMAALSLLPAIIAVVGNGIDRWRVPSLIHHPDRTQAAGADGISVRPSVWERWATLVATHAWPFAIFGTIILLVIAWPVLSMRLGESDDGNLPTSATQRQAYDLVAQGFGPGTNGPLLVVVSLPSPGDDAVLSNVTTALAKTPGVEAVLPAEVSPNRAIAQIVVLPTSAPDSAQTADLVGTLRSSVLPHALGTSGAHAFVGGVTAAFIDIGNRISDRLPYFIGAVVLLSFFLLMLVFHSILVPLTAALMNLLSVGAAYGATVAVFQWGWFKGLIGLQSTVPIVSFVPMMMFAVLFGLSMDYQVFLLTRVREEYDKSGNTRQGVVRGLARTARVITSAALIMIFVFGAFVLNFSPEIKMFGLGLAFAVLVDATIVRMMLVPSIMEILGDANWWFPKWLGFLPRLDIEGGSDTHESEPRPQPAPEPVGSGV